MNSQSRSSQTMSSQANGPDTPILNETKCCTKKEFKILMYKFTNTWFSNLFCNFLVVYYLLMLFVLFDTLIRMNVAFHILSYCLSCYLSKEYIVFLSNFINIFQIVIIIDEGRLLCYSLVCNCINNIIIEE